MKNEKSQISSETLIYVLTLFAILFVLIAGYKYFEILNKNQQSYSFIILKNNLKNDIANVKEDSGAVKIKEYSLPEGADEICFVDKSKNIPLLCAGCPKSTDYRIVADRIIDNSTRNVLLLDDNKIENTFSLESVKIGCCAFKCFKAVAGKLKLTMQGDGKYTIISQK